MFPIRCFTCNKVIGHLWYQYKDCNDKPLFFEEKRIRRFCCRRMFLTHVDNFSDVLAYKKNNNTNSGKQSERIVIAR